MMRVLNHLGVLVVTCVIASAGTVLAVDQAEVTPASPGPTTGAEPLFLLPPAPDEELFVGTGGWGTVANPAYTVDVDDGSSTTSFSGIPVGGAVYDAANGRILFTSSLTTSFSEVWSWPLTGTPIQIGNITNAGVDLRIDGLAFIGSTLYGVQQFDGTVPAGIFSIDATTWIASSVLSFPAGPATTGGLSGLAGDSTSGLLYAPDDNTGQILSLDPVGGTVLAVAAYPGGETDIDGAAFGNGAVYLVPDQAGSIYPFDVAGGVYATPITSPFSASDTFSGAAFLGAPTQANADLELFMTCSVTGGGIDCSLTVNNNGPDDATGVTVDVTIPGGLTYASDTCAGGAMAGTWTWNVGALANGASAMCTLSMTIDAGSTGPWTLYGTVVHPGTDPDPSNNRSTEQVGLISPIPTLTGTGVMMLVLGLIVGALIVLRRSI
jgi:uncharacterized repeat protein (TIGR01451 family)